MSDAATTTEFSLEQLYTDLQEELRTFGHNRADRTGSAASDRTAGLAILVHTPYQDGPVEVTDFPTSQGHLDLLPDPLDGFAMDRILYRGSAILSLACGGTFAEIADNPRVGTWYLFGRPRDIRQLSRTDWVYQAALRYMDTDEPKPRDDDLVVFNKDGIVRTPTQNICLRGLRAGLDRAAR